MIACVRRDNGRPWLRMYYAQSDMDRPRSKNLSGVDEIETSYKSGIIKCRFSRKKKFKDAEVFDLGSRLSYYLLVASGIAKNGDITNHGENKSFTLEKIDFTKARDVRDMKNYRNSTKSCFQPMALWVIFSFAFSIIISG